MAVHRQSRRLGPGHQVGLGPLAPLRGKSRGNVRQSPGMGGEFAQASRPVLRRQRDWSAGHCGCCESSLEVTPGESLTSPIITDRARSGAGQRHCVVDPSQRRPDGKRLVDHLTTCVRQYEQMAGQIAAVHRRDVRRFEPVQVARVVPVVQVAAEALQANDSRERRLQTLHHLERPDPTEVTSRHGRQQVHPDIGRRGAVLHGGPGIVLEVVRRQRMVLRTDERLEEPPGPARRQAKRPHVGGRQLLRGRFGGRQTDPSGDGRRKQPQDDEWGRDPRGARLDGHDEGRSRGGDDHAAHHVPVEPGEVEVGAGLRLRGCPPLEEVPPGRIQPHQSSQDRIDHQPSLVRQECQAEAHMGDGQRDVRAHRSQVAALGDTLPFRHHSCQHGQSFGNDRRCQHESGPDAGRDSGKRPGCHERGQHERSRHRPAQVVDHLPAGDAGDGSPAPSTGGVAGPAKDPGQKLPVAARPAVLTDNRDQVVRGVFVEELDVGHEPCPGKDAFEKVVAQERVLGHAVCHRGAECVEVVDPLAGEAPLPEQVLVDVRDGR